LEKTGFIKVPRIALKEVSWPQPVNEFFIRSKASFIEEALKKSHAKVTRKKVTITWKESNRRLELETPVFL
jgi:hypothetical protein